MSRWQAERLSQLPAYLFAEIDRKKREAKAAGRDIIDLGVGDPDSPTPAFIVDRMGSAIRDGANHKYAFGVGMREFRAAVANYFKRRYGVLLEPQAEVISLLGSKEGIGHLPTAVVNPGEVVLCPAPGYPVYVSGTVFAGGVCHTMPLKEENGWLPVLEDIPAEIADRAKILYLNYPNNPTSACAPLSFFEKAVAFCKKYDILLVQDAAYSEIYFDAPPPSVLQVDGAKDVAIELHSFSKTFNMTGWRLAFAVGNADALAALAKVKSNLDSGVFQAVQVAGIEAISHMDHVQVRAQLSTYKERRDILVSGMREAGFSVIEPQATFYVWSKCPAGLDSWTVANRLLDESGVVVIPGGGMSEYGEGFVRLAMTVSADRSNEAVTRIAKVRF